MDNAYGARELLKEYLGIKSDRRLRISEIVWQHGWLTGMHNRDPDTLVGESGQTSYLADETYLVARVDQEDALKGFGVSDVHAIGLPFAYALKLYGEQVPRIPGSVVVMPTAHGSLAPAGQAHLDLPYIQYLLSKLDGFGSRSVLMNCDDFENKRNEEWERHGFEVEIGACADDSKSLKRLVQKLSSIEVMTTNGFGSHVVYAAASGCRVSIDGPQPKGIAADGWWGATFYVNRPDLVKIEGEVLKDTYQELRTVGLFVEPKKAREARPWGLREIGFDRVLEPGELAVLLREAFKRHWSLLDRMGFRPVIKKWRILHRTLEVGLCSISSKRRFRPLVVVSNFVKLLRPARDREIRTLRPLDSSEVLHFRPGTSDEWSLHQLFIERELDGFDFANPSRILCLGSYAGYGLRYLVNRFPSSRVVGVEADPDNVAVSNLNTSAMEGVRVLNVAVAPSDGEVSVLKGTDSEWSSKSIPVSPRYPVVRSMSLATLLNEIGWKHADLLIVDIEGSEYEVLRSVAPRIKDLCSLLIVRFTHRLARQHELEEILAVMTAGDDSIVKTRGELTLLDFR